MRTIGATISQLAQHTANFPIYVATVRFRWIGNPLCCAAARRVPALFDNHAAHWHRNRCKADSQNGKLACRLSKAGLGFFHGVGIRLWSRSVLTGFRY